MESQNQLTKSNMESQLTESLESTHTQNAWSIFGLLLSQTRPVSLPEIASRFDSIYGSPSYIRFLCSIPNSPLHLTTNEYVGVSSIGLFYIARFVSSINLEFRNHNLIGFQFERLKDGDGKVLKTYKRRKCVRGKDECHKIVKRRKMDFHEEEDNRTLVKLPVAEHRSSTQIYLVQDNISKSFNITINNPLDMAFSYKLFEERNSRVSWLINSNAQIWKTTAHDRENTCVCVNEKHICTLSDSDNENTSNIAKLTKENRLLNLAYLPEAIVHKTTVEGTEAEDILSRTSLRETHQMITCDRQASSDISTYQAVINWNKVNQIQEFPILADDKGEGHVDDIAVEETASDCLPKGNFQENITMRIRSIMPSLGKLKSKMPLENETISAVNMLADDQKHLENSQSTDNKPKFDPWEILTSNSPTICETQEKNDVQQCIDQQHSKREKKSNSINKNICEENDHHKERKEKHKDSKKKSFNISENVSSI
ncbi:hypothetical protein LIER_41363 [Lithospermum erythrorhizon]|uniref:Uncharacterized protein n=1 Tax=Lithospermum erythrorhizon TaxID=34254 RepID=A0AAV3R876_LITER